MQLHQMGKFKGPAAFPRVLVGWHRDSGCKIVELYHAGMMHTSPGLAHSYRFPNYSILDLKI